MTNQPYKRLKHGGTNHPYSLRHMMITCKNCKRRFKGNFCSECGQPANTHDINVRFLWHDIQHGLFHVDGGILYNIKELFTRPGHTLREYIAGKRVKHFKPISFIIVVAGIYGFVMHYFHLNAPLDFTVSTESSEIIDFKSALDCVNTHYAITTLLFLPIISLSSYVAFRKEKYNYLQHIIINSYLSGFRILLKLAFVPLLFFVDKNAGEELLLIPELIAIAYTVWTFIQLFQHLTLKKRILKVIMSYVYLGLLFIAFIVLIAVLIAIYIHNLGGL